MIRHFALFTYSGEGMPVAKRLIAEGEDVLVGVVEDQEDVLLPEEEKNSQAEDPERKEDRLRNFENILKRVSARKLVDFLKEQQNKEEWFLIFDFNHLFKFADRLKGLGFAGNFPTAADRRFEVDRDYAKEFVKKNYPQVKVAEKRSFAKIEEAENFLRDSDKVWVLKSNSDGGETVVPEGEDSERAKEELLAALSENRQGYEEGGFFLEEKIPQTMELTPCRWYWNGRPVFTDLDIEAKKLGDGETGRMTGCSADLVFETKNSDRINKIAFPPAVEEMAGEHPGLFVWDISLLFDPATGEAYMGEFCPNRFGYNALYNELARAESAGKFFGFLAAGKNPYQADDPKFGVSLKIFGVNEGGVEELEKEAVILGEGKNFWPEYVLEKDGKIYPSGFGWDIAVVTAQGNEPEGAIERLYDNVKGVSFASKYSRSKEDFLSKSYAQAILARFEWAKGRLFDSPAAEVGYDFDGVITAGIVPLENSVIITGNSQENETELRNILSQMGKENVPIHFIPRKPQAESVDAEVGRFKAEKIKELGIKKFFEDKYVQASIIKRENPQTEIIIVQPYQ